MDEDPWELPYKTVTKKLVGRQQISGLACSARMSLIVVALFPVHEERIARPKQKATWTPFSIEELQTAAKSLKPRKAPGPDYIPNEIVRTVVEIWPEVLLEAFNKCVQEGVFHSRWKRQTLVLLSEGDKPFGKPSSYRPISLIDTTGKLFERLLLRRLEEHINDNGGLSSRQYGFQKGRSTVDAIAKVTEMAAKVKRGTWQ